MKRPQTSRLAAGVICALFAACLLEPYVASADEPASDAIASKAPADQVEADSDGSLTGDNAAAEGNAPSAETGGTAAGLEASDEGNGVVDDGSSATITGVSVTAHVQDYGWMSPVTDGSVVGTTGKGKRLEAMYVKLLGTDVADALSVEAYVNCAWQDAVGNGELVGSTGEGKAIEALRITLSEELSSQYSIWYRVHSADVGWLGWAHDGEAAGTVGYGHDAQAVQILILPKDSEAPGGTDGAYLDHGDDEADVVVSAHVKDLGWMSSVKGGSVAGTTGRGLRIEAIQASVDWFGRNSGIELRAHVSNVGWQEWQSGTCGTTGRSQAIEAIQVRVTGDAAESYDVWYRVHSADYGWLGWTKNGGAAGTVGLGKQVEAVQIKLVPKGGDAPGDTSGATRGEIDSLRASGSRRGGISVSSVAGKNVTLGSTSAAALQSLSAALASTQYASSSIQYQACWQYGGWDESWAQDGVFAGGSSGDQLKAVRFGLSGDIASAYSIWYRAYDTESGWTGWAKDGEAVGRAGGLSGISAVQLCLVAAGEEGPGSCDDAYSENSSNSLLVQAHVADAGWLAPVGDGEVAGQTGKSRSLQAVRIALDGIDGDVVVQSHVANIGWQDGVSGGAISGTTGKSKAIEAVRISLTGEAAELYDIYYCVHSADYGWLGWACNGDTAGTSGLGKQAEAIKVMLVAKGEDGPSSSGPASLTCPTLSVSARVASLGWQAEVGSGSVAGTTGMGLDLQGLKMSVSSDIEGGISYSAHVSNVGWQTAAEDGSIAGSDSGDTRIEAVRISLTGELSKYYDVYYRVHSAEFGWLGWTYNGRNAGTSNCSLGAQAIQVKIVAKGSAAPGETSTPYLNGFVVQNYSSANDMQRRVVASAQSTGSPGNGLCAMWVSQVFNKVGLGYAEYNACDFYWNNGTYSKPMPIKVGMVISVPSHTRTYAGSRWGHVAIYIGDGKVMDNVGYIRTMNLDDWIGFYGTTYTPKWGWYRGIALA